MIDAELACSIAKSALKTGGFFSEVFCQRRKVTQVRFEDGRVDDVSVGVDSGAGVRVIRGDLASYAHTDILDADHLERAAATSAEALEYSSGDHVLTMVESDATDTRAVCPDAPGGFEIKHIVDILELCDEAARGLGKEIVQLTAIHTDYLEEELLADSLGETRSGGSGRTRLVLQAVARRNGVIQVGQEAPGRLCGPAFYEMENPEQTALVAARRAIAMLDAQPAPTGRMPVVVSSGTGGVMLHEACGHGLEIDHVHKGASVYRGKVGDRVASELVSASDNPTIPEFWGSYQFDDEGTPARGTRLIEKGILRGFLYDRHAAMKDGLSSTANGRRQSFRYPPIPRMSNTYIEAGDADPADIIRSTGKGLYARKMGGGQVDPSTGDYVFSVSEGYLIDDGRIGPPVRGATLIGNGPKTLEIIDAVGSDLSFEAGTCGKDGQGVPVTTGCPTFRIAELTVGGTEL